MQAVAVIRSYISIWMYRGWNTLIVTRQWGNVQKKKKTPWSEYEGVAIIFQE